MRSVWGVLSEVGRWMVRRGVSKRNVHVFVALLNNESVVLVAGLVVMCVKKGAENWLFE